MDRNVLSAAFHVTIPVLMGYLAIGMAFGLMMDSAGYNVFWALLMSLIIYAGAGQYMGVTLLAAGASPLQTALMTLLLNFRHMFYGLSMLEKFRGMGLRKLLYDLFPSLMRLMRCWRPPRRRRGCGRRTTTWPLP